MTSFVVAAMVQRVPTALRRIVRIPMREYFTMWRVLMLLVLVEGCVRLVSLPRLTHLLGIRLDLESQTVDVGDRGAVSRLRLEKRELRQLRCIRRLLRHWPFGSGPCLRHSLVAARLLRHRQPVVRLGVARCSHELTAHAWVEVQGVAIGGSDGFLALRNPGSTS